MDLSEATIMFDALSQETRLGAFRLLVKAGPDGLPAGALSDELGTPHNTMSFHLNHLSNARIVTSWAMDGRQINKSDVKSKNKQRYLKALKP